MRSDDRGGNWAWVAAVLALIAVGAIIWAIVATGDSAGPETGASVEEVTEQTERFEGASVTLSGDVSEVATSDELGVDTVQSAFRLSDNLPVVVPQNMQAPSLEEGELIQVEGEIHSFNVSEFEDEFGAEIGESEWFEDLDENQAVLVAREIDTNVETEEDEALLEEDEAATEE